MDLREMRTADEWGRRQIHGGHRGVSHWMFRRVDTQRELIRDTVDE
jgi:hypothetical protein